MMVEFSTEAESDLEQIADFIAQDNPRRVLSFVEELRSKCFALADSPLGFPLVLGMNDIESGAACTETI